MAANTISCWHVLDVPQLLLRLAAVSATVWSTPGHNSPRLKNGSKYDKLLSPPQSGAPQDTTDPDSRMAAKAPSVAWMLWTFLSCSLAPGSVSTKVWMTPGHNKPRFKNGSKYDKLLACAGRSSAALAPGCCLRHSLDHPRSQPPLIEEWQQKHAQLLGCAGHF